MSVDGRSPVCDWATYAPCIREQQIIKEIPPPTAPVLTTFMPSTLPAENPPSTAPVMTTFMPSTLPALSTTPEGSGSDDVECSGGGEEDGCDNEDPVVVIDAK